MLGEYKNCEVIMRPTVMFRAPKVLRIPGTLMTMIGKMELEEEKNRIVLTYHIKVNTPGLDSRNYRIVAIRSLDFARVCNDWRVEATADTRYRLPHRFEPEVCRCHNINTKLEEALDEATQWISKEITEFALYNTTEEDMNYHLLD